MKKSKNPIDKIKDVDPSLLACSIGDKLVVKRPVALEDGEMLVVGDTYLVSGRKYYGWDLTLFNGTGPENVRALNSNILDHFSIAP